MRKGFKYKAIGVLIFLLRPPFLLIGAIIKGIYFLFFGWWLDPKVHRQNHSALVRDVCTYLEFVFTDYGAKFRPNLREPPRLFDFAQVTLSVGDLVFQIFRGRGEVNLTVASSRNPTEFHEFSTVLSAMDVGVKRQGFGHLLDIEKVLKPHMQDLATAFSAEHYPKIRSGLADTYARDRIITKQWETEINRRLYG